MRSERGVIGTPLYDGSVKIMVLGSGELGKEIVIEAQRLGIETIAVDRYENAPAQQVAHKACTVNMLDGGALKSVVHREKPDVIVPEVEAINTDALVELEEEGFDVIPSAKATKIAMDRRLLRDMASRDANVKTSRFAFASSLEDVKKACDDIGYPCLIKARMSSGGLGSSIVFKKQEVNKAYERSVKEARGRGDEVIVESLIEYDLEVTELPVAHLDASGKQTLVFCRPIGHVRSGSHYHVSWQPFLIPAEPFQGYGSSLHKKEDPPEKPLLWSSKWNGKNVEKKRIEAVEKEIYDVASKIVKTFPQPKNGFKRGVFGCELFIRLGDPETGVKHEVYFNEISPRPHDTGMVTLATQDISEMALHIRAILGLPIPEIRQLTYGSSHVILASKGSWAPTYSSVSDVLSQKGVYLRLFGKPVSYRARRMGVALAADPSILAARRKALEAAHLSESGIIYG